MAKQYPEKETFPTFGQINIEREVIWENDYEKKIQTIKQTNQYKIYLDHSCDEWEIGDEHDAETMSEDLLSAAVYCKLNPLKELPTIINQL